MELNQLAPAITTAELHVASPLHSDILFTFTQDTPNKLFTSTAYSFPQSPLQPRTLKTHYL